MNTSSIAGAAARAAIGSRRTVAEASESINARGIAVKAVEAPPMQQATGQKGAASGAVVAGKPPLPDYLNKYFASRQPKAPPLAKSGQTNDVNSIQRQVQELSRQAAALSENAMSEAWALRRLAKRHTPEELARLSPKARGELENIIREQVRSLKEQLTESRTLLMPVLESIPRLRVDGSESRRPGKALNAAWPDFPLALFDLVNYIDRIANGAAPITPPLKSSS